MNKYSREGLFHHLDAFVNPKRHWEKYHNRCYTNSEFRLPDEINSYNLRKVVRNLVVNCKKKETKTLVMDLITKRAGKRGHFRFDGYLLTPGQFEPHLEREIRHAYIHR